MVKVMCGNSGLLTVALCTTMVCQDHDSKSDVW